MTQSQVSAPALEGGSSGELALGRMAVQEGLASRLCEQEDQTTAGRASLQSLVQGSLPRGRALSPASSSSGPCRPAPVLSCVLCCELSAAETTSCEHEGHSGFVRPAALLIWDNSGQNQELQIRREQST